MESVKVVWKSYHEKTPARGYWDQGVLEALFTRELYRPAGAVKFQHLEDFATLHETGEGAVVIIPARYHADDIAKINADLKPLRWCLVILVGDEEAVFPSEKLEHPNMMIYVMTPHIGKHPNADRYIVNGWPPETRDFLMQYTTEANERPLDWFFAGQVTHNRRKDCVKALRGLENGKLIETPGFTQGVPHEEYFKYMASAKVVPCPSGAVIPDSFRMYEALEAGALPIADGLSPSGESKGYWNFLFDIPENLPFPVLEDWAELPGNIQYFVDTFPKHQNKAFAWWQGYKREMAYNLEEDLHQLRGTVPTYETAEDSITVLIPTSPIPSHPDTRIIDQTIRDVRAKLPDSEIILMIDGVREQQEDRRADYDEYIRRLLWKTNFEWRNVVPVLFEEHHHQAAMASKVMDMIKTPLLLYVEHDAPLTPDNDFEWEGLVDAILTGQANTIRFHFESAIPAEHQHLMLDKEPVTVCGVKMVRTAQWSQRPHLSSVDFYKWMLRKWFSENSRTMIEDKIHGVVWSAFTDRHKAGWNTFKLWIYTPDGNIQRSYTTDGRQDDPKYDMVF